MWILTGFGGEQALRLVVNLILARLLFPSSFGTIVLIQRLNTFSDVGTRPAVMRSSRGDGVDFLNTAWTIEIMRGLVLSLVCCAIVVPDAGADGRASPVAASDDQGRASLAAHDLRDSAHPGMGDPFVRALWW